jgi:hypothetical protein
MFSRIFFVSFFVIYSILASVPAHSAGPIYSWQDASGVVTFTDNAANAPSGVQVKILSAEYPDPQAPAETGLMETSAAEIPERPSSAPTQGEFSIQLAEELGLGEPSTAREAADILTSVRIAPKVGRWELDRPMTPELTVRLRTLTVASAKRGWITISPEQALLAFDTAAALLDAPIPAAPDQETSESPYPIVETPPEVYLYPPPPEINPYYIWEPVAGGFWWNDFLFPGFFALNADLFFFNHHHHRFFSRDRLLAVNSFGIQRHFRDRIADHRFGGRVSVPGSGRVRSGVRSASVSNRVMNPHVSPRSMMTRPAIRRQSSPFNSIASRQPARSAFPASSVRRSGSSSFSAPRHFASSMSHGFSGHYGGGFGHTAGRGSSHR